MNRVRKISGMGRPRIEKPRCFPWMGDSRPPNSRQKRADLAQEADASIGNFS